jgi:lipopolysaccharide/colanic/teichoic acid biosynthesis glycosyltransferase
MLVRTLRHYVPVSRKRRVKRLFDVLLSSVLLLITLPVTVLTAILIILENPGPIFYRQRRIGECGRPFALLRFRDTFAGTDPERRTSETPVRFTRVGAVIHRLSIDELPQLLNILRGEMSFVGPRPERPAIANHISRRHAYYPERHAVKPGITGWAQMRHPSSSPLMDAKEKLQEDRYYTEHDSLGVDLLILGQTVRRVLFGKGAH